MLNLPGGQFNTFQFNEHVGFVAVVAKYLRKITDYVTSTVYSYYKRADKEYQKR